MSERFAATYIAAAGSVEAAKELVVSCASYIAREKQNGREIRSVAAILSNAAKNFLTGAAVKNIVWGLSSKEDKYRDLYLNRLKEPMDPISHKPQKDQKEKEYADLILNRLDIIDKEGAGWCAE